MGAIRWASARAALERALHEVVRRHEALLHVMIHTDPATDGLILLETPAGAELAEKFAGAWRARLVAADLDVRQVREAEASALEASLAAASSLGHFPWMFLKVCSRSFPGGRVSAHCAAVSGSY